MFIRLNVLIKQEKHRIIYYNSKTK